MSTIAITGGTGLVGKHLSKMLVAHGQKVIILTRTEQPDEGNIQYAAWNPDRKEINISALQRVEAVVHLAGAGVADKRWTNDRKKEIISSRVGATSFLLEQLRINAPMCKTFIAASATGYYGPDKGPEPFMEDDPPFNDFLAKVCVEWEAASLKAQLHYRTVIFRFGIVLGKEGGAYPKLSDPMKLGVMPVLGSGKQMVSWIHADDLARLITEAIDNDGFSGIYNAVAPSPVSHREMMKAFALAKGGIKIPVPVPHFALKLIMGESSIEVLKSCTASAEKLLNQGFTFKYGTIQAAATALAQRS